MCPCSAQVGNISTRQAAMITNREFKGIIKIKLLEICAKLASNECNAGA